MILSDGSIWAAVKAFNLIDPFVDSQLQPASYDLRLGEILDGDNAVDSRLIMPKEFLLASTMEIVHLPDTIVGRLEGKSSLARQGLIIHTAGFIDPGFSGQLTLEITNLSDKSFPLEAGMLICQIAFSKLDKAALRPYGHPELHSHYQNQIGVTQAR